MTMSSNNRFPLDPLQQTALAAITATPDLLQTENTLIPAGLASPKMSMNLKSDYEDYSHHGLNE